MFTVMYVAFSKMAGSAFTKKEGGVREEREGTIPCPISFLPLLHWQTRRAFLGKGSRGVRGLGSERRELGS